MSQPRQDSGVARRVRHALALGGVTLVAAVATTLALPTLQSTAEPQKRIAEAPTVSKIVEPTPEVSASAEALAVAALAPVVATPAAAAPAAPELQVNEGTLKPGDSLVRALKRDGIPQATVNVVIRALTPHFDFRRSQPGHRYRMARDPGGELVEFRYRITEFESIHLTRNGGEYAVVREEEALVPRQARIASVVTSSLYQSIRDLGESGQLAADFSEIFAWDVDFSRSVRAGDEFSILYERLHRVDDDGNETYVRPGRILAAHYEGQSGSHTAVYFEPKAGSGGYYRPDGSSVQRDFLMAPVRYARVTSRYSGARRHPILNVTRPHQGIDYAAPHGTPVWAVANGEVIYRGWAGGFGNLVKIRHQNGYVSYYSHLSRFARGLSVGQKLRQKQVLGYVGSTGLATGPHVCFRVARDGKYVDPAGVHAPVGPPIPPEIQPTFASARDHLIARLVPTS